MTPLPRPAPRRGAIAIGDALAVLKALAPADTATQQALGRLLGYELQLPVQPAPVVSPPAERPRPEAVSGPVPDLPLPEAAAFTLPELPPDTEPDATDLPPVVRGQLADVLDPLPDVSLPDPFAPRPTTSSAPAPPRLLAPQYERNILRALCVVDTPSSEIDLERTVARLSAGDILERLPYRRLRRPARRVDIWHDVSDSMQPFAADQAHLARTVRMVLGSSVRNHYAAGLLPVTPAMLQ